MLKFKCPFLQYRTLLQYSRLGSDGGVHFIFFRLEILFWANLVQQIKIVSSSWNLVLRITRIWTNQWWCSFFLVSIGSILFGKFVSKNHNCWNWNIEPRLTRICRIRWWFLWFSFFDWKNHFCVNLVLKFKIVKLG